MSIRIVNRKAAYAYEILESFDAGLVLTGTEIKSVRDGKVNLQEAYCYFKDGALVVRNMYIGEYTHGNLYNHEPRRPRLLLLKRHELKKLLTKTKERGLTIAPLVLHFNQRGLAKLEIALVKGKKTFDKSASIKEKDVKRDTDRALREH